ncbi:MAG: endospore germination permease [Clostridium cochlearium]|uniref:GerAB/ArcD/ProY family transporter n=1 Tax=Clostridium cochlearium TaxID=1494 RepID=UPI00280B27E0|nr:endospore germination permease [Clostridium cochlearium]MDU1443910.1 endospore germination permease [Clostridium cochlearium]
MIKLKEKNIVSSYGLFVTLVVTIIGVNVFSIPRDLTTIVGVDGWISIIIGGVITYISAYLIYKCIEKSDYKDCYHMFQDSFGKIIGNIIGFSIVIYSLLFISIALRTFTEEIKMYLLQDTPTEFIFTVMILSGIYLIRAELEHLIRFNEISFWIMFVPIIFVLLVSIYDVDFTNLLPVLKNEPLSYFKGSINIFYRFGGIGILFMIIPILKNKNKAPKVIKKSILFTSVFYVVIFVLSIGTFGEEQSKMLLWPTITMISSINIPGSFIQKWEGIVMAIWIMFYYTSFINYYYLSSDVLKNILKLDDIKLSSAILVPFIYIFALYPENIAQLGEKTQKLIPTMFIINMIIVPILIIIASHVKKGGKNKIE